MTHDELAALATIRGLAAAGRVFVTDHCAKRMGQRNVTMRDLRSALVGATDCRAQGETWRVDGPDADGDALTCVAAIENGVVVVTVY